MYGRKVLGCAHKKDPTLPGCSCTTFLKSGFNAAGDDKGWQVLLSPKPASPSGKGWQMMAPAPTNGFKSASGAFYFGDKAKLNYDWGKSQGHLVSPVFTPNKDTVVAFWLRLEVEADAKYDKFQVAFLAGGKLNMLIARDVKSAAGETLKNKVWQRVVLPLSSFAGTPGNVVWTFTATDGEANKTRGAFLDDVEVSECAQ